jgi:transposase-like protein
MIIYFLTYLCAAVAPAFPHHHRSNNPDHAQPGLSVREIARDWGAATVRHSWMSAKTERRHVLGLECPLDGGKSCARAGRGHYAQTLRLSGMAVSRRCKECGNPFESERRRGRPRLYCMDCCPEGYKVVHMKNGYAKLRRVYPPNSGPGRHFSMWRAETEAARVSA